MRPYMQRVGGRPVIRKPLRIVRYRDMKRHDISISLLGYDMITSVKALKASVKLQNYTDSVAQDRMSHLYGDPMLQQSSCLAPYMWACASP